MFFVREREAKRRKRKRESARETAREREREGSRLCVLISYRVFVRERRKEDLSARPAFSFSLICCCHFDLLLLVGFVVVSLICCCCFDHKYMYLLCSPLVFLHFFFARLALPPARGGLYSHLEMCFCTKKRVLAQRPLGTHLRVSREAHSDVKLEMCSCTKKCVLAEKNVF